MYKLFQNSSPYRLLAHTKSVIDQHLKEKSEAVIIEKLMTLSTFDFKILPPAASPLPKSLPKEIPSSSLASPNTHQCKVYLFRANFLKPSRAVMFLISVPQQYCFIPSISYTLYLYIYPSIHISWYVVFFHKHSKIPTNWVLP